MRAPVEPAETAVTIADLSAGDVIRLPDWTHPAVVEAISDARGAHRSFDVTFLRFGTAPSRLALPSGGPVVRLDLQVWWHTYTNASGAPAPAWVRGKRILVPAGRRVAVVDADPRSDFAPDVWDHDRQPVRTDHLERPGWQTLRPSSEQPVGQSLTG